MDKLSMEEALALLAKPTGAARPGRVSKGAKLVEDFLASGAIFARESFANEEARKAIMLSIKKYLKDAGLGDKVWVVADGYSIVFTNMGLAAQVEGESGQAIVAAFNAYKDRYANVGRGKSKK